MSEQKKQVRRKEQWKKRVRNKERQRETATPWPRLRPPVPLSPHQRDWVWPAMVNRGRRGVWSEAEPGKEVFSLSVSLTVYLLCFSILNSMIKCLCQLAVKLNSWSPVCFACNTPLLLKFHCRTDICSVSFIYSSYFLINLQSTY